MLLSSLLARELVQAKRAELLCEAEHRRLLAIVRGCARRCTPSLRMGH